MSQPASSSHAPFAPSAMHRIIRCPASVRATAGIPETSSDFAKDGTEAHDLLAWALKNKVRNAVTAYQGSLGAVSWTHRTDTYEARLESVQDALDEVYDILDSYEDAKLYVETRVHFPSKVTTECWGTADIVIVVASLGLCFVIDFKHGAGKYVAIEDNEQLETYTCAVIADIPEAAACHTFTLCIIQPRAFSATGTIRKAFRSHDYMQQIALPRIDNAIAASQDPNAPFVPGEIQCQFCPIKANCKAREAQALAVVSSTFRSVKDVTQASLPIVSQLPVDRLAFIMSAADILRGWLKDVEDTTFEIMRAGAYVPGWKVVEVNPRRRWLDPENTAVLLMSLIGTEDEDVVRPRSLIGITEAEKLVKDAFKANAPKGKKSKQAEIAGNAMALLTTKESSGNLKMVPESDPAPAVNLAQKTFAQVALPMKDLTRAEKDALVPY